MQMARDYVPGNASLENPYSKSDATGQREKYPPRPSPSSTSVHIPLLDSDELDGDPGRSLPRGGASMRRTSSSSFSSRSRLHPYTLIPAFILGILIARSGFFGRGTIWWQTPDFVPNSYSTGPTNDVRWLALCCWRNGADTDLRRTACDYPPYPPTTPSTPRATSSSIPPPSTLPPPPPPYPQNRPFSLLPGSAIRFTTSS